MQKFYSLAGIGAMALLFSIGLNYSQRGEINAMRFQEKIYEAQNRLLEDQLRDYEYKAYTTRTYEEGLTEGLVRSSTTGYKDGYHAAMAQVEETKAYFAEQDQIAKQKTDSASKGALPATVPTSTSK